MSNRTVLVVEDDPAIRRGLADALTFAGYRVHEAADAPSGLEIGLRADLDLVLLDVVLPGGDGFSILEELRDARPGLPVILVTARGAEGESASGG